MSKEQERAEETLAIVEETTIPAAGGLLAESPAEAQEEARGPKEPESDPAPSSVSQFLEWLKGASTPDVRECRNDDSWPSHWTEHDRHAARCALAERITHERGGVVSMPPS